MSYKPIIAGLRKRIVELAGADAIGERQHCCKVEWTDDPGKLPPGWKIKATATSIPGGSILMPSCDACSEEIESGGH